MLRIGCSILTSLFRWACQGIRDVYRARLKYSMQGLLFAAQLARDLPTSQDNTNQLYAEADSVFICLERTIELAKTLISFFLQLRLILHVVGAGLQNAGPTFIVLCILPLVMNLFLKKELWGKQYVVEAINKFYLRKVALLKLADDNLKIEVLGGGISDYLLKEYRKAQHGLRDTPDTHPEQLYRTHRGLVSELLRSVSSQSSMLYFAFLALVTPSKLSVVQLAILEQTNLSLRQTFWLLANELEFFPEDMSRMREFYAALDIKNQIKDGDKVYPQPGYDNFAGMSIELRRVSFSYPNTVSDRPALENVSFTIHPGQLVVIVGCNGSGKSTLIKLLSRLYDPTSGTILVDGIPIQKYRIQELRRAIAMLTQDHQLFPLSVEENIALGAPDEAGMKDSRKLEECVRLSGSEKIVNNFSEGVQTVLEPIPTGYISFYGQGNEELGAIFKTMKKSVNLSGKQPLYARMFMRLTTPVKLATIDEPSSALDPSSEFELFLRLRAARKGRTMIFVTHRFGHLTKHADLIICLRDGMVEETGTHPELLAAGGEYARLYNVQAEAFTTQAS
ncbi:P-loop containing nucleoside triphosphate hydrolase protein [Scleroderma citrinum]